MQRNVQCVGELCWDTEWNGNVCGAWVQWDVQWVCAELHWGVHADGIQRVELRDEYTKRHDVCRDV